MRKKKEDTIQTVLKKINEVVQSEKVGYGSPIKNKQTLLSNPGGSIGNIIGNVVRLCVSGWHEMHAHLVVMLSLQMQKIMFL